MIIKKQKGFTLIELMVSIAVLAILVSVALPAYERYVIKSQASEAFQLVDAAKLKVEEYFQENGEMPSTNIEAQYSGTSTSGSIGNYVGSISVKDGGVISVKYGSKANIKLQGSGSAPTLSSGSTAYFSIYDGNTYPSQQQALNVANQGAAQFSNCSSEFNAINGLTYMSCTMTMNMMDFNTMTFGPRVISTNATVGQVRTATKSCAAGEVLDSSDNCIPAPSSSGAVAVDTGVVNFTPEVQPEGNVKWGCVHTLDMAYIPAACSFSMNALL